MKNLKPIMLSFSSINDCRCTEPFLKISQGQTIEVRKVHEISTRVPKHKKEIGNSCKYVSRTPIQVSSPRLGALKSP